MRKNKRKIEELNARIIGLENFIKEMKNPFRFEMLDEVESDADWIEEFSGIVVKIWRDNGHARYDVYCKASDIRRTFRSHELKLKS